MEEIPTLRPSREQFEDPIGYLSSYAVRKLGMKYGMIKMIPPADFKPLFSIDQERFSFQCRLQTLMELDIENRSRLFFWKQLNNLKSNQGHDQLLSSPQYTFHGHTDESGRNSVYFYDIYKAVIQYCRDKHANAANDEDTARTKKTRKRSRNGSVLAVKEVGFQLWDPRDVMRDEKLWDSVNSDIPSLSVKELKRVFRNDILPYYRFLHNEIVSKGADTSHISGLLYKHEFPKSLLEKNNSSDSESEEVTSSGTEQEIFSDDLPEKRGSFGEQEYEEFDDQDEDEDDDKCPICSKHIAPGASVVRCISCDYKFHRRCLGKSAPIAAKGRGWICNTCIIGNGYYGFKVPSSSYTLESFKQHCCKFDKEFFNGAKPSDIDTLESIFWDQVENIRPNPITVKYGADIHNALPGQTTGFPTENYFPASITDEESEDYKQYMKTSLHPWNLINLPRAKGSLLSIINRNISGMTVPWIYIGSTFSTFCWHLEDQYTLSANYQHIGSPKVWYSIPERSVSAFDKLMKSISPDLFARQPDLLHQLITLVSPYSKQFVEADVDCYRAIQNPGEYIITYPKCYHAGFNSGFNFNEAVNFTLDLWLPYGLQSISDYKFTKRTAVVNLFDLMSNVLSEYLINQKSFDDSFVAICVSELKEWFNADFKTIMKIKEIVGQIVFSTGCQDAYRNEFLPEPNAVKRENESDVEGEGLADADIDVFCSVCKTICANAFVVRPLTRTIRNKRRNLATMSPGEWNKLSSDGSVVIYCLEEYMKYVETEDEKDDDQNEFMHSFEDDILIHIREPEDTRSLITAVEKVIERRLR